jgi:hypothetical protein
VEAAAVRYVITVPVHGRQSFWVEAVSERAAKTKVGRWIRGLRGEGEDLEVGEIDATGTRTPAGWIVEEEG